MEIVGKKDMSKGTEAPDAKTKAHNSTYCRDWVRKTELIDHGTGKIVIKSSTEPECGENVSSLCDASSVSHTAQNYIKK